MKYEAVLHAYSQTQRTTLHVDTKKDAIKESKINLFISRSSAKSCRYLGLHLLASTPLLPLSAKPFSKKGKPRQLPSPVPTGGLSTSHYATPTSAAFQLVNQQSGRGPGKTEAYKQDHLALVSVESRLPAH